MGRFMTGLCRLVLSMLSAAVLALGGATATGAEATSAQAPISAQAPAKSAPSSKAQASLPSLNDCDFTQAAPLLYRIASTGKGVGPSAAPKAAHCTPAERALVQQRNATAVFRPRLTPSAAPAIPSKFVPGVRHGQSANPAAANVQLSGKVTNMSAAGVPAISLRAESHTYCCYEAITAGDGTYSLSVPPGDGYWILINDSSGTYPNGFYDAAGTGNFTIDTETMTLVAVGSSGVSGVNITLPSFATISGRVTPPAATPVHGVELSACAGYCYYVVSADDGTYSMKVASTASYTIFFDDPNGDYLNGTYSQGAPGNYGVDSSEATPVPVPPAGVSGINIDLPSPVVLRGTVTNAGGFAVPNPTIKACAVGRDACLADHWSGNDGSYMIYVAPNRRYTLTAEGDTFSVSGYYDSDSPGNFTLDPDAATVVSVATSDIAGLDLTLPKYVGIGGLVVNPAHVGINGLGVEACDSYRCYAVQSYSDGYYTVNVPPNDGFYVSFFDGVGTYATGYFSAGSSNHFSADPDDATVVSVDSTSINGIAADFSWDQTAQHYLQLYRAGAAS